MGGTNNGRISITMDDWMRDMEKRVLHEERRPLVRSASDLLGPGLAPTAVQLLDWNDPATAFNGFFWTAPGAINSPDGNKSWMGFSVCNAIGDGYQMVYQYTGWTYPYVVSNALFNDPNNSSPPQYFRTFNTPPGLQRSYGPWINPMAQVPIQQFGTVNLTGDATNGRQATITFPVPFPSKPFVQAWVRTGISGSSITQYGWANTVTPTTFVANAIRNNTTNCQTDWSAIWWPGMASFQ